MARLFDDASSEYLLVNQAVAGYPFAVVAFFEVDDLDLTRCILSICDTASENNWHQLFRRSINRVTAMSQDSSGEAAANSTLPILTNTLYHAAGIFVSSTDKRAFTNGGNKGTSAAACDPQNLDATAVGARCNLTTSGYMSGMIAEAAIYDLSAWPGATVSDKADNFEKILLSLAKGFSPLFFPLGLVAYWPLIRETNI